MQPQYGISPQGDILAFVSTWAERIQGQPDTTGRAEALSNRDVAAPVAPLPPPTTVSPQAFEVVDVRVAPDGAKSYVMLKREEPQTLKP